MPTKSDRYETAVARCFEARNADGQEPPGKAVDGHHDTARSGVEPVDEATGSAPVAGFDVITLVRPRPEPGPADGRGAPRGARWRNGGFPKGRRRYGTAVPP
ncbi:hypothetical protein [Streptomyces torulosus]|uniref:hypothetical protein n=1 Tax=Streptomyces torulosus TaxID=68276 RepID=UPI001F0A68C5|nr:hypothetical protein [Streptomyces torulosus]